MLDELLKALNRVEYEFGFQASRLDKIAAQTGNTRLRELHDRYVAAAETCRMLKTHQLRRKNLMETGDSFGR